MTAAQAHENAQLRARLTVLEVALAEQKQAMSDVLDREAKLLELYQELSHSLSVCEHALDWRAADDEGCPEPPMRPTTKDNLE